MPVCVFGLHGVTPAPACLFKWNAISSNVGAVATHARLFAGSFCPSARVLVRTSVSIFRYFVGESNSLFVIANRCALSPPASVPPLCALTRSLCDVCACNRFDMRVASRGRTPARKTP